jgi:hypothetical protein
MISTNILFVSVLTSNFISENHQTKITANNEDFFIDFEEINPIGPKIQQTYTYHDPVVIWNETALASSDIVIEGDGSEDNPFVISGWAFTDPTPEANLDIRHTRSHIRIENCQFSGRMYGIYLYNVTNVAIDEVEVSDMIAYDPVSEVNCIGIFALNSHDISINNSYIHDLYGINGTDAGIGTDATRSKDVMGVYLSGCGNFTIENVEVAYCYGGNGGDGTNSSTSSERDGGYCGIIYGIYTVFIPDDMSQTIKNCYLHDFYQGNGGQGYDGSDDTTTNGNGFDGGNGGHCYQITPISVDFDYGYGTQEIDILSNRVKNIYGGTGGNGGTGGKSGTISGYGGNGGNGGQGGGIYGLHISDADGASIIDNIFSHFFNGNGGNGGDGGEIRNDVGTSGNGGDGGDSYYSVGIRTRFGYNYLIKNNHINNIYLGYGGDRGAYGYKHYTVAGDTGDHGNFGSASDIIGFDISFSRFVNVTENFLYNIPWKTNKSWGYDNISVFGFKVEYGNDFNYFWLNHFECTGNWIYSSGYQPLFLSSNQFGNYWSYYRAPDINPRDGIFDLPYECWDYVHNRPYTDYMPFALSLLTDTDGDGLLNIDEYKSLLNPYLPDTDNDGISDGDEIALGTNPLISDSSGLTSGEFIDQYGTLAGLGAVGVLIVVMGLVKKK